MIHSNSPDNRYKVRGSWFQGVIADIDILLENDEITDSQLITECKLFMQAVTERDWKRRTTHEEIEAANGLIDKILK